MVVSFKNMYQSAYRTMLGDKTSSVVSRSHVLKPPPTPLLISEELSSQHFIQFQNNLLKIIQNYSKKQTPPIERPAHNKIMGYLKTFAEQASANAVKSPPNIQAPKSGGGGGNSASANFDTISLERTNYYSDLQNNLIEPIQSQEQSDALPTSEKEVFELLELWRSLYEDEIEHNKKVNEEFEPVNVNNSYSAKTESNILNEREQSYQSMNSGLDPITSNRTYISMAEGNILNEITQRYQNFLERKEASLKEKAEQRQKEEDLYFLNNQRKAREKEERIAEENRKLYEKEMDKKASNARKRFTKEQFLDGLAGLLFGSRSEEKLKISDSSPQAAPQKFEKIHSHQTDKVEKISPITPVKWGSSAIRYTTSNTRNISFKINRLYNKIFAGIYRTWIDQNVFFKCIHPERGPPSVA